VLAIAITVLAVSAAGFAIAVAHSWASCHSFTVRSYPKAYPSCRAATESDRPMVMAGMGGAFLVLAVLAGYLWIEDASPVGESRRRR